MVPADNALRERSRTVSGGRPKFDSPGGREAVRIDRSAERRGRGSKAGGRLRGDVGRAGADEKDFEHWQMIRSRRGVADHEAGPVGGVERGELRGIVLLGVEHFATQKSEMTRGVQDVIEAHVGTRESSVSRLPAMLAGAASAKPASRTVVIGR